MAQIDPSAINGAFKLQVQTPGRRRLWIFWGAVGAAVLVFTIYASIVDFGIHGNRPAPAGVLIIVGVGLFGLLMVASSFVVMRQAMGLHLNGIQITPTALEPMRLLAQADDPEALKGWGRSRLHAVEELEKRSYPSAGASVGVTLAQFQDGPKDRFYLASLSIHSEGREVYQLVNATHQHSTHSNDLCIVSKDGIHKFSDTMSSHNESLAGQLEDLGTVLEISGVPVFLSFKARTTSKLQAGALGGLIGGLVAAGIDEVRQGHLRNEIDSGNLIDPVFTSRLRGLLGRFKWEII